MWRAQIRRIFTTPIRLFLQRLLWSPASGQLSRRPAQASCPHTAKTRSNSGQVRYSLGLDSHPAGGVLVIERFSEGQQAPRGFHLEAHRDVACVQKRLHQQRAAPLRRLPLDILQIADALLMEVKDVQVGESLAHRKVLPRLSARTDNEYLWFYGMTSFYGYIDPLRPSLLS